MLVFVSYSTKDRKVVDDICSYLSSLNIDYWMDEHELMPGQDWKERVLNILHRVDAVLFCMSDNSQQSENVKWELQQAENESKPIVPVRLSKCDVLIKSLESIVYIDLYEPESPVRALNKLAEALRKYDPNIGRSPAPKIFINYRQGADPKDQELAEYLSEKLDKHGADVWSDLYELEQGEHWGQVIKHGIDSCDWMLQIVSLASMHSRRVDAAWREFINQGKEKHIILIMNSWTPVNFKLNRCTFADFTQDWSQGWGQLLSILSEKGATLDPPIKPAEKIPVPNKLLDWHKDQGSFDLINPQVLQPRHKFTKPEAMIQKAQHEIWISGVSMIKVAQSSFFHMYLSKESCKLRFLIVDPREESCLTEASSYLGLEKNILRSRIEVSLGYLSQLRKQYPEQVEIRVMKHRPSIGYFIIDPENDRTGAMTVSPYLYRIDELEIFRKGSPHKILESPFIYLTLLGERQSFEVFCEDFNRSWGTATEWEMSLTT